MKGRTPRAFGIEGQWGLSAIAPQGWEKLSLHSWRAHTRTHRHRDPAQSSTSIGTRVGLTRGPGGSPGLVGGGCNSLWGQGHRPQRPQGILISVSSPRGPCFGTKTWPHPTAYRLQSWNPSVQTTSKTGTQPHPSANRLHKVILVSQLPQKTLLDTACPPEG